MYAVLSAVFESKSPALNKLHPPKTENTLMGLLMFENGKAARELGPSMCNLVCQQDKQGFCIVWARSQAPPWCPKSIFHQMKLLQLPPSADFAFLPHSILSHDGFSLLYLTT